LLDPGAVTITSGADSGPNTFGSIFIHMALASGDVINSTSDGLVGNETLTVTSAVTGAMYAIHWATDNDYTLIGRRNVVIQTDAQIQSTGGGNLTINANTISPGGGFVGMQIGAGASLSTASGILTLTGLGSGSGNQGI